MDDIKNHLINECPSCGAPDQGGQFCDYCKRRLRTPKIVSTQKLYADGLCVAIYEKFSDGKTVVKYLDNYDPGVRGDDCGRGSY